MTLMQPKAYVSGVYIQCTMHDFLCVNLTFYLWYLGGVFAIVSVSELMRSSGQEHNRLHY